MRKLAFRIRKKILQVQKEPLNYITATVTIVISTLFLFTSLVTSIMLPVSSNTQDTEYINQAMFLGSLLIAYASFSLVLLPPIWIFAGRYPILIRASVHTSRTFIFQAILTLTIVGILFPLSPFGTKLGKEFPEGLLITILILLSLVLVMLVVYWASTILIESAIPTRRQRKSLLQNPRLNINNAYVILSTGMSILLVLICYIKDLFNSILPNSQTCQSIFLVFSSILFSLSSWFLRNNRTSKRWNFFSFTLGLFMVSTGWTFISALHSTYPSVLKSSSLAIEITYTCFVLLLFLIIYSSLIRYYISLESHS